MMSMIDDDDDDDDDADVWKDGMSAISSEFDSMAFAREQHLLAYLHIGLQHSTIHRPTVQRNLYKLT